MTFEKGIIEKAKQLYQHYKVPWTGPSDECLKVKLLGVQCAVTVILVNPAVRCY